MTGREAFYYWLSAFLGGIENLWRKRKEHWASLKAFMNPRGFLRLFLFEPSTNEPFDAEVRRWIRSNGVILIIMAWFMLIVVNGTWAWLDNRFWPDGTASTLQFLEDVPDLIDYLVICPLYVGLGVTFIVYVMHLRENLVATEVFTTLEIPSRLAKRSPAATILWAIAVCLGASVMLAQYGTELNRYSFVFWFQNGTTPATASLSGHGYYYFATNTILNLIMGSVVVANVEMFRVAAIVGRHIRSHVEAGKPLPPAWYEKKQLLDRFAPFTSMYVLSKILVLVFLANLYTWRAQGVGAIGLLEISTVAYLVLGMVIVGYPRYHVQNWIFKAWQQTKGDKYIDLRRTTQRGIVNLVDFFVLGAAATNLIVDVLVRLGMNRDFWLLRIFK